MTILIYQVDAFSDRLFAGNPAAVCLLDQPADEKWMQSVAREMNLSETAFLVRCSGQQPTFDLRWFTPGMEVDLCGHATLASVHALWESGEVERGEEVRFRTRSGVLTAAPSKASRGWIRMDFPADPPREQAAPAGLERALGADLQWFGLSRNYHFGQVATPAELAGLEPDFRRLRELVAVGICVTTAGNSDPYDFESRFFAPGAGIDEDPVTGSAHCLLAPFWKERLGRSEFLAYQASPRGGVVRVEDLGERVAVEGQAVTVWQGRLSS